MSAHVTAAAVWTGEKLEIPDLVRFNAEVRGLKPAAGECFVLHLEREGEAILHGDYKHLYGHVYLPVVEFTGTPDVELHLQAKARFMPDDGRTSITQLTRPEFLRFKDQAEEWLRDAMWEAFEAWSPEVYRRKREARRRAARG